MKKSILVLSCLLICIAAAAQNKSYTFVFLNNKPDKEVLSNEKADSIMQGHIDNIGRLAKEGKLLAAGPFEGGGGIFILNTTSVKEANEWLSTDPGVQAKRWNIVVSPYTVRNGSVCPVGEKYDMVFYQFIRFTAKENLQKKTQHIDSFVLRFFKENHIIHAGMFDTETGIMIVKADVAEASILADPAVRDGLINYEMKKTLHRKGIVL